MSFYVQLCSYSIYIGAFVDIRDAVGKYAFDYIRDYEEWIQSGHFTVDIVTKLRGIVYAREMSRRVPPSYFPKKLSKAV